jgi:hypothetical protein
MRIAAGPLVLDGDRDDVFDHSVRQKFFANLGGSRDVGFGNGAVEVKFDSLADANVGDFAVAVAVKRITHSFAGWV